MSAIVHKRSVTISGHRTSFSLEDAFHAELERMAFERGCAVAALVASIDAGKPDGANLSSALRLAVLEDLKAARIRDG